MKARDLETKLGTRQGVRTLMDCYRRFPSLYSSWEDIIINVLGNSEYEWHKGNIRMIPGEYRKHLKKDCKFKISESASVDILEHNIEYLRHDLTNCVYPIPAQCIPDDITPFWFHTIEFLCYKINKIHPPDFYKFRYYHYKTVSGIGLEYCRNYAERQTSELKTAQKVIKTVIEPRLREIREKRHDNFIRDSYASDKEFHNFQFPSINR